MWDKESWSFRGPGSTLLCVLGVLSSLLANGEQRGTQLEVRVGSRVDASLPLIF